MAERLAEPEASESISARAWHHVAPLLAGVALALLIRALVIETFYVPSESMLPTLLIGDHVFVSKYSFGARVPFTDIQLPAVREPERGDVVVFDLGRRESGEICPLDRCPDARGESFVKRIAGLPGDVIEFRRGVFYLNDERVPTTHDGETFQDEAGREYRVLEEDLAGREHKLLDLPRGLGPAQTRVRVPPDHYFMLGDNRDHSNDSRGWGVVPRRDIRGPVILIYWSWNNQESWLAMANPWTWIKLLLGETRWGRMGERVP